MVFHGSMSIFMVFQGPRLVFHGSRLVSKVFHGSGWVVKFMVPGPFFTVTGWYFMVPSQFYMVFRGSR